MSGFLELKVSLVSDDRQGLKVSHRGQGFRQEHLVLLVVEQELLLVVDVYRLDLIQEHTEHGMHGMVLGQGVSNVLRHGGDDSLVDRLYVPLEFNGLVCLFLSLLGQLESLGEPLWVFILELNGQSAHELQQSVL